MKNESAATRSTMVEISLTQWLNGVLAAIQWLILGISSVYDPRQSRIQQWLAKKGYDTRTIVVQ